MHFAEIMRLQFGKKKKKKRHTLLCILLLFRITVALLSLKMLGLLPMFFSEFNRPCQDLLSLYSHTLRKNTSLLGGTVLKFSFFPLCLLRYRKFYARSFDVYLHL